MGASHGWAHIDAARKQEIISAIVDGTSTSGPSHAELDLTDRCNVACYFCNQQDLRTKEQISIECARRLIDEMAEGGLRSVRLAGGGDPLFHREIGEVIDHLHSRGILVDNVTTNAVALTADIARRLIDGQTREVIISLNAADAADYHRMMRVKPALFQRVLDNVTHLTTERGDRKYPEVVVQFLLDRENFTRIGDMYAVGRSIGADRIAVNPVLEIPRERIDRERLLAPEHREQLRPHLKAVLEADRDHGRLQINFPFGDWNVMLAELMTETGIRVNNGVVTAASFREGDGGCFFAWYSMAVTGNGRVYPCCLLLNPDYEELANVREEPLQDIWNGEAFTGMREEMRDVLLTEGKIEYRPERFKYLKKPCVEGGACYLKNMYFRADEDFYRDLGAALDQVRKREVRWFGTPRQIARAAERRAGTDLRFRRVYRKLTLKSRGVRQILRNRLGLSLFSR